jgi:hypothetical protein
LSRKSEFACGIRGYDALAGALCGAASRKQGARAKLHAQGLAYVDFALRHPGRFQMMFANKRLVAEGGGDRRGGGLVDRSRLCHACTRREIRLSEERGRTA